MQWFYKSGELAKDGWNVVVDRQIEGWQHTGLRIGELSQDVSFSLGADEVERIIFLLQGTHLNVKYRQSGKSEFQTAELSGRKSVFDGPADMIYLPIATEIFISGSGRVAVCEAPANEIKPVKIMRSEDVPVLIRGAGAACRQVHNFGVPEELDASRFIVVEVLVPSGNWSGIPAHKHDTYIPGVESNLEEIYYFETQVTDGHHVDEPDPTGFMRGYSSDERPYDITEEVRTGDVGLVPWGWHGPVAATPGSDLYFLNIMAGPDPDRSWNITDHPSQAWIRETWPQQEIDARLPFAKPRTGGK